MKTIMKIMLVLAIVSVSVMEMKAQYLAEMPSAGFQSTSSMVSSGSQYQSAAVSGFVSADDYYATTHSSSVRKVSRPGGEGGGGSTEGGPDDPSNPFQDPIGEGVLVLMALAGGYAVSRKSKVESRK
ncbi:MAG: hypothetical protein MJZ53_02195 [Paludibacteraceae bacterium]|nr:hypothetical protein [Paludibacteraceae bacterium]